MIGVNGTLPRCVLYVLTATKYHHSLLFKLTDVQSDIPISPSVPPSIMRQTLKSSPTEKSPRYRYRKTKRMRPAALDGGMTRMLQGCGGCRRDSSKADLRGVTNEMMNDT